MIDRTLQASKFFQRSDFAADFFDHISDLERWTCLAKLLESFESGRNVPRRGIPRIVHQIWLGGQLPSKYRRWSESWIRFHKGWEYVLWDEKSILNGGFVDEKVFKGSPSLGAKSDLARYGILQHFGGVYADTDFECLASFDDLAGRTTFFAGTVFDNSPQINNGLVGAIPGHPLLNRIVEGLSQPVVTLDPIEILNTCGAYYLTRTFFANMALLDHCDVILPSTYFYPLPNFVEKKRPRLQTPGLYARPWSLAIHYWETSWIPRKPVRAFLGGVRKWLRHLFGM